MFKFKTTRPCLMLLAALTFAAPIVSAVSSLPQAAAVVAVAQTETATRYESVKVNGQAMTADPMVTTVEGETYVALRSVAQALDSEVQAYWDGKQAKVVHWGVVDVIAVPGQSYVVANERYLYVPNKVQARNGAVLIPLATLCKAFDATYAFNADGSISLTTGSGAILHGGQYYDSNDLYWLSHIINAESGNQPLTGKMAVGNVVLNRVADSRFPNSIHGVVFQKNQFSPVANGSINKTPNAESVLAAKLCLDGGEALEGVLWFNQKGLKCWASRNRTFVATIAGHSFYA